jgi:hypothetical protein
LRRSNKFKQLFLGCHFWGNNKPFICFRVVLLEIGNTSLWGHIESKPKNQTNNHVHSQSTNKQVKAICGFAPFAPFAPQSNTQ